MTGAYLGTLVTGLVKGVTRQRASIRIFGLIGPVLFAGWYFLVLAVSFVTTGACLSDWICCWAPRSGFLGPFRDNGLPWDDEDQCEFDEHACIQFRPGMPQLEK